jgi:glycosyltransferase involved in cell wall biosynthesis
LVSVIIPVYNAGRFLRPAVLSVLAQTHRQLEVIVIDDGSTDGCVETIRDLDDSRIVRLRQENRGKPAAMNAALRLVKGKYFAVNDADDLSERNRIQAMVSCMEANPDLAAVFSGYSLMLNDKVMAPLAVARSREACAEEIRAFRMPSHDPTAMFRMDMTRGMEFDETLLLGEGLDFILRVGEQRPMMVLGECLYIYRIHSSSITHTNLERRDRLVRLCLAKAFERRGLKFTDEHVGDGRTQGACEDNNLAAHFIESVCYLKGNSRPFAAIGTGLRCIARKPLNGHYWKAFCYSLLPYGWVKRFRERRRAERYRRITQESGPQG